MKTIHNIVVAKPVLDASYEVIDYALALAHDLKAKLTIVLCYASKTGEEQTTSFSLREDVEASFKYIKSHFLQDASVEYRLVSSDRSLCEYIEATLGAYHPDMLIVATEHVEQLPLLIKQVKHPLLLVPPQAKYHPVQQIAVAYDATSVEYVHVIQYIAQMADIFKAKIHIVEVSRQQDKSSLLDSRSNVELDYLLKDTRHAFHFLEEKDVASGVVKFVQDFGIDVLVMLARQHLPAEVNPAGRHTQSTVEQVAIPVMVLKI